MHFQFIPRLPKLELPNAPEPRKLKQEGVPVFRTWTTYSRAGSLGFHSQRKNEPLGREVWGLVGKGSQGKAELCRSDLVPSAPLTPSRSTEDGVLVRSQLGTLFWKAEVSFLLSPASSLLGL